MKSVWAYLSIYFLTAADLVFTHIGLGNGVIEEANPFMNLLLSCQPMLATAGVLFGTALILYFLYKVRLRVKWLSAVLMGIALIKLLVVVLHFYWMIPYYAALNSH